MADDYLNLYSLFEPNEMVPFIEISKRNTDKYETFIEGSTTYDALSYKYYGNSLMGWVIKYGNPQYADESLIDNGKSIRIPFPISTVIKEIKEKVNQYKSL